MIKQLTKRISLVLIVSVISVAVSIFVVIFLVSYNATIREIKDTADNISVRILHSVDFFNFDKINFSGIEGAEARAAAQIELDRLTDLANFHHLYIGVIIDSGSVMTSLFIANDNGEPVPYIPSGRLYTQLYNSLTSGQSITSDFIYTTASGYIYYIFWPILNSSGEPVASLGMEFDVTHTYRAFINMLLYSLVLSVLITGLFLVIAHFSIGKVNEPVYQKLAYTDIMTGLQNRLAYEQRLRSCETLLEQNISFTIIIFDINNLKAVNDNLGHKAGDLYIAGTIKIILEILGDSGDTYRTGGDEFASVLIGKSAVEIENIIDALSREDRSIFSDVPFSCAFGCATYTPGSDTSISALVDRADREMYGDKARQKERIAGGRRKN